MQPRGDERPCLRVTWVSWSKTNVVVETSNKKARSRSISKQNGQGRSYGARHSNGSKSSLWPGCSRPALSLVTASSRAPRKRLQKKPFEQCANISQSINTIKHSKSSESKLTLRRRGAWTPQPRNHRRTAAARLFTGKTHQQKRDTAQTNKRKRAYVMQGTWPASPDPRGCHRDLNRKGEITQANNSEKQSQENNGNTEFVQLWKHEAITPNKRAAKNQSR